MTWGVAASLLGFFASLAALSATSPPPLLAALLLATAAIAPGLAVGIVVKRILRRFGR